MIRNTRQPPSAFARPNPGFLLPLLLLVTAVVGQEGDAFAAPDAKKRIARREPPRPTGRTIQQNLLPPVTMPARRPDGVAQLLEDLVKDLRSTPRLSRQALRRMLRSGIRARQARALAQLLRRPSCVVPFADVVRLARSHGARLSLRLLAIRAALLPGVGVRRASEFLLRLTHGGAVTIREAAYRGLNRLPRDSRSRCRRFSELLARRGLPATSMRLVARGVARNCVPHRPRTVLRAARRRRVSVRLGIAEGLLNGGVVARRALARLGRDAHGVVRRSARVAQLRRWTGAASLPGDRRVAQLPARAVSTVTPRHVAVPSPVRRSGASRQALLLHR